MPFLNFFFARIERNPARTTPGAPPELSAAPHWTEDAAQLQALWEQKHGWDHLWTRLQSEGMSWWSKCQGEWNVIHAVDTPIVYRHLSPNEGTLTWGGDFRVPFRPGSLRVHPDTGYLYHPSPEPILRRQRNTLQGGGALPWGRYSLVASHVVLQHLSEGLHIDLEAGVGGHLQWRGQMYTLDALDPDADLA